MWHWARNLTPLILGFLTCKKPGKGYQDESRVPTGGAHSMAAFIPSPFCQNPVDLGSTPNVLPEGGCSSPRLTTFPGITALHSQPHTKQAQKWHPGGCRGQAGFQNCPRNTLINISPWAKEKYLEEAARQSWDGHYLPPLGSNLFENWSPRLGPWAEAQTGKGRKEASPGTSLQIPTL